MKLSTEHYRLGRVAYNAYDESTRGGALGFGRKSEECQAAWAAAAVRLDVMAVVVDRCARVAREGDE